MAYGAQHQRKDFGLFLIRMSMNILIPNATGPTNIGDQAILKGLLGVLREKYPNAYITIHTSNPELYSEKMVDKINPHLYFWAAFSNRNNFIRVTRLLQLFLQYILCAVKIYLPVGERQLLDIVDDYRKADLIVFVGGGYMHSKTGFTQTLNLLMILFIFRFARLFSVKKIVAPMSFGPFGYEWQEYISTRALRDFDIVGIREKISLRILEKYHIKNVILSVDHAFFVNFVPHRQHHSDFILGFTIRDWLPKKEQANFENNFANAISRFSKGKSIVVQPIVQVGGVEYGEFDGFITDRLATLLKKIGLSVLPAKHIESVSDAISVYANIDLLLGMRMHSNILASLSGTPLAIISYEHKADGIAELLRLDNYVISCNKVTAENLSGLLQEVYELRGEVSERLRIAVNKIREMEILRWKKIV